ncbi:MAG: nuclear transport factor 2 family protein [Gemmatimonadaceae bacterium]
MRVSSSISALAIFVTLSAPAVQANDFRVEPRTEAAVLAASDDWLAAEHRGDVAELDRRLMPEYRDISPNGRVHLRAELIAHAANLKDPSTVPAKQLAAEVRKAHPTIEKVVITGNTALLSYYSADPQAEDEVLSLDVFVYDHGRWRGLASMNSSHS